MRASLKLQAAILFATSIAASACSTMADVALDGQVACATEHLKLGYQFPGGGLHACTVTKGGVFNLTVYHEDVVDPPINPSPWYAFEIAGKTGTPVDVVLDFGDYKQRYSPKVLLDSGVWSGLEPDNYSISEDRHQMRLAFDLPSEHVRIAGQPLLDDASVKVWSSKVAETFELKQVTYGRSFEDRPLVAFLYGKEDAENTIIALTRQHPPETTGAQTFQYFIPSLLQALETEQLDNVKVLFFPMMNPDGVTHGYWRLNAGGFDLNRNWYDATQPEVAYAQQLILENTKESSVLAFLDFHSTRSTLVYSHPEEDLSPANAEFPNDLKQRFDRELDPPPKWIPGHNPEKGTSKGWALENLDVAGLTIELADDESDTRMQLIADVIVDTIITRLKVNSD
ncbi:MAG: hypothetical protein CME89_15955 [Hirschia sp.]|nr:hypothetical protein [Hirschia sp.]